MRGLSHGLLLLLRLLGTHGVAVLGGRPPGAQVLLLLLEQPLVERLLEQGLRRRSLGPALWVLRALRLLLLRPPSARTPVTALQAGHGVLLLLLLHLEVVLVL